MFVETEKIELPLLRRTQRIFARIPLCVAWKNQDQINFEEQTFTIAVNANGGLFQLRNTVRKGQRLSVVQPRTGQQEFCIVAHVEPIEGGYSSVRVQFLEPDLGFWPVTFPPEDWTPRHPDSKFNRQPPLRDSVAAGPRAASNW